MDMESTSWKSGKRMNEKPRDDQKEADRFECKISGFLSPECLDHPTLPPFFRLPSPFPRSVLKVIVIDH
jgi:hypothetical protein